MNVNAKLTFVNGFSDIYMFVRVYVWVFSVKAKVALIFAFYNNMRPLMLTFVVNSFALFQRFSSLSDSTVP